MLHNTEIHLFYCNKFLFIYKCHELCMRLGTCGGPEVNYEACNHNQEC